MKQVQMVMLEKDYNLFPGIAEAISTYPQDLDITRFQGQILVSTEPSDPLDRGHINSLDTMLKRLNCPFDAYIYPLAAESPEVYMHRPELSVPALKFGTVTNPALAELTHDFFYTGYNAELQELSINAQNTDPRDDSKPLADFLYKRFFPLNPLYEEDPEEIVDTYPCLERPIETLVEDIWYLKDTSAEDYPLIDIRNTIKAVLTKYPEAFREIDAAIEKKLNHLYIHDKIAENWENELKNHTLDEIPALTEAIQLYVSPKDVELLSELHQATTATSMKDKIETVLELCHMDLTKKLLQLGRHDLFISPPKGANLNKGR